MHNAGHAYDPLDDAPHFARLLARARGSAEAMGAVREYLAAWPKARIASLQRVDGGWAPFDARQQPDPLYRPADVRALHEAVRAQCASLRGAGVTPARELLELEAFLCRACVKLAEADSGCATPHAGSAARPPESRAHR